MSAIVICALRHGLVSIDVRRSDPHDCLGPRNPLGFREVPGSSLGPLLFWSRPLGYLGDSPFGGRGNVGQKRKTFPRPSRLKIDWSMMMDANHISERLSGMRQEINDLQVITARYWIKRQHTPLDKSAFALRKERLLEIKRELSDMMKRRA